MKKLVGIVIGLLFLATISVSASSNNIFESISETSEEAYGIIHKEIIGKSYNDDKEFGQVINVLEANTRSGSSIKLVTGDVYDSYGWGLGTVKGLAKDFEENNPDYMIIGGVNGDFFNTTNGHPCGLYVRNGEVIFGNSNDAIGVKGNGVVVMGKPTYGDLKLHIYDEDKLEKEVVVNKLNEIPSDGEVSIFFDSYIATISDDSATKYIVDATDIRTQDLQNISTASVFGKGNIKELKDSDVTVPTNKFVIVSKNTEVDNLLDVNDKVIVQRELTGLFKDVQWAVGAYGALVEHGKIADDMASVGVKVKHPRTAIGVRRDGTVFFVTVDGRQESQGMYGVELPVLAQIMLDLGAETAYNLDGGGSTTMIIKNDDNEFDTLNSPSDDGGLRRVSNAIFFATKVEKEIPQPDPDDNDNDNNDIDNNDNNNDTDNNNGTPFALIATISSVAVVTILLVVIGIRRKVN